MARSTPHLTLHREHDALVRPGGIAPLEILGRAAGPLPMWARKGQLATRFRIDLVAAMYYAASHLMLPLDVTAVLRFYGVDGRRTRSMQAGIDRLRKEGLLRTGTAHPESASVIETLWHPHPAYTALRATRVVPALQSTPSNPFASVVLASVIAAQLAAEIADGTPDATTLPDAPVRVSLASLGGAFWMNKHKGVRHAVERLEQAGLIERTGGKGATHGFRILPEVTTRPFVLDEGAVPVPAPQSTPTIPAAAPVPPAPSPSTAVTELERVTALIERWAELVDRGRLTVAEFNALKTQSLGL